MAHDSLTRRELGGLMAGVLAATPKIAAQTASANPGPVLDIASWSFKFYGV